MTKRYKSFIRYFFFIVGLLFSTIAFSQNEFIIKFVHTANGKRIIQNDSIYYTPGGEPYTISKLKYYVSNLDMNTARKSCFLIDAFGIDSFTVRPQIGLYAFLSFLLGVDSARNVSGAQDGALDPLNDMFWTWNSGYVMFKLEGNSDSSLADLHRIEHHIGGFAGTNYTMRRINLSLPKKMHANTGRHVITVEMNLDNYWRSVNNISISETPVIVTAGALAKRSADNFPQMFTIKSVE